VTEAAAVGVPAIFVPLPIGNGEQALNAAPVVDAGGALLVATRTSPRLGDRHVPALATTPRGWPRWAPRPRR
jgi:UDP-N-acetylglucosamine--N-acetylmuramyl-(pentapeptide) pyrophosphoryl-undecaprenol N-acetylglucosamine transferase